MRTGHDILGEAIVKEATKMSKTTEFYCSTCHNLVGHDIITTVLGREILRCETCSAIKTRPEEPIKKEKDIMDESLDFLAGYGTGLKRAEMDLGDEVEEMRVEVEFLRLQNRRLIGICRNAHNAFSNPDPLAYNSVWNLLEEVKYLWEIE